MEEHIHLEFNYKLSFKHKNNTINKKYNADYYIINDDEATKKIFEFLANNTNVEWSEVFIQESDNLLTGIISTTHLNDTDASQVWILENLGASNRIISATHNHTVKASPSNEDFMIQERYGNTRLNTNTPIMFYILFKNDRVIFPVNKNK